MRYSDGMENAAIGTKVFSGNSMNPSEDTVVGVFTWLQLTEKMRNAHTLVEHWLSSTEQAERLYVVMYSPRRHKSCRYRSCSMDVFTATHYESRDAMIRAYAEKSHNLPALNPFCGLPGGY
jgi:hypothetical protein